MNLQDRIDRFQKVVFASFRMSSNNECRIASLVPLVEESYGIYKFITNMLRAMHKSKSNFMIANDLARLQLSSIFPQRLEQQMLWLPYVKDTMHNITPF